MYLTKQELKQRLDSTEEGKALIVRPLLSEKDQLGEMTIDLRLGTDFLLINFGREASVDVTGDAKRRPFQSLFTETRRLIGEPFIFYPHQSVLCSTLEYIKVPNDIFLTLSPRSSYSRLGFTLSTIVQPGYCGCISLELTNNSSIPVKVLTGASIIQARAYKLNGELKYFSEEKPRKYYCQVRPQLSKANDDGEISILRGIAGLDKPM